MIFSSRLPKSLEANEFTKTLEALRASGHKITDLTQSNPTSAGFTAASGLQYLADTTPPTLYHPSASGLPSARGAIKEYYRSGNHGHIDADDLLLTASTSEAYSFLLKLLTDPGDEILIPAPSYPLFDFLATLENVRTSRYLLQEDCAGRWRINFTSLEEEISRLTRAIVVVNPNNPTGSLLTATEMKRLSILCQTHGLALIVDEVFLDYSNPDNTMPPCSAIGNDCALTFTLSGLSKVLALPQVKLSWIHINGPQPEKDMAKQRLEFIADTYLSVNGMIQQAAASLFTGQHRIQKEILERIGNNESLLRAQMGDALGLRESGWYALITLPQHLNDEQCCLDLLHTCSLLVHPGFFYDFTDNNRIVISLITPEDEFRRGIDLLQDFFARQQEK